MIKQTTVSNPFDLELQVYEKGKYEKINPFLNTNEVECNCSYKYCTRTIISSRTEKSFYLLRSVYGAKILVNSGYRCQYWNSRIGGALGSFHMLGCALDIRPENEEDFNMLLNLAEKFFDVVIPYKNEGFIHVHNIG